MASCVKLLDVKTNEEYTDKNGVDRVKHTLQYQNEGGAPKQVMIFENNPLFNRVNELGSKLTAGVEVDLGWSKEPNKAGFRDLVQIEKKGTLAAEYTTKKWNGKGGNNGNGYGQPTAYSLAKDLSMAVSGLMQALIESGTPLDKLEEATLTAYGIKKKIEASVGSKTETPTKAEVPPVKQKPAAPPVPKAQRYEGADDSKEEEDTPW